MHEFRYAQIFFILLQLLYCLRFYRGDEKIRSFIWDLITPSEHGELTMRNHLGLKDPVPRGIRNKNKKKMKDTRHAALTDPNHWSKNEKYDGDIFLESNYKKHLGRHANKYSITSFHRTLHDIFT